MSNVINIRFDTFALGDNVLFMPYVEEYRKITGKTVLVSTFFNSLFHEQYPELIFCDPNNHLHNIEKLYLGVYVNGIQGNGIPSKEWRSNPLQKSACELLDIPYEPIRPKISTSDIEIPFENYITISQHTSRKNKYWHNPTGWQEVVDYCVSKGLNVVVCSKEPTNLKNVIDCTGEKPLLNRAKLLEQSKMFIGVSSGLSTMAWAVNTPVIMISGATNKDHEFPCHRVINENVCHGCINCEDIPFDEFLDCPFHKGTDREYECSKQITSQQVIKEIDEVLTNGV